MDLLVQLQYITTVEPVQEVIAAISEQAQLSSDLQVRGGGGGGGIGREEGREVELVGGREGNKVN